MKYPFSECQVCRARPFYHIVFESVNQYDNNLELFEWGVCDNFERMAVIVRGYDPHGKFDYIIDNDDNKCRELTRLLELAYYSADKKELEEICKRGQELINTSGFSEGQKMLFNISEED